MKTVYALSGISGAGKTHFRTHTEKFAAMPYLDIADVYEEYPLATPQQAFMEFMNRFEELMRNEVEEFVLEAYFNRSSQQRYWLEEVSCMYGYTVKYIVFDTPWEECVRRVQKQYEEDPSSKNLVRLQLLGIR